ncbi:PLP-dependent aminotransferase family protein [Myceligenerans crystallogenes]|uniref:PLP-dependent aminotransferase family protein n=1 Tax=Myceligenerans crystallogenes TaxID=316335 RepID=A0ABP4ZH97_9MICO
MPGADFLQLDPAQAPPGGLTTWLTDTLRAAVADGRLAVGDRLPATRVLAGQLAVSRGVVVEAYQRLTDEGLLGGRHGGGTVVRAGPLTAAPRAPGAGGSGGRTPAPGTRESGGRNGAPGGTAGHPRNPAAPGAVVVPGGWTGPAGPGPYRATDVEFDLTPGRPDLSAFPRAAWGRAERAALASAPDADLGYGDPRGVPALREALAGWLARNRGLRAHPDEILVVNGVAQGLVLLARVLAARGRTRVAFEDPGSRGMREHLERWDLRIVPVPVDDAGLDTGELARTGADVVVTTPAHQFPTGVVLAAGRRRELIDWARERDGLIVEDDYDAEHRYDRPPVAALHSLAPEHVLHVGSVSKTLAPAIRLGWMVAPPGWREELTEAKYWLDLACPALPQHALAGLVTSGAFERHLRLVRRRHRARRDALLAALAAHLPGAAVHGVAAGLHLLVTLPDGVRDDDVAARALAEGVLVQPLSAHRLAPGPPGLVIGYATTPPDRLREAVRRLARAR